MSHRLTIQELANLCNYSWEVEKGFGFHMDPNAFKTFIGKLSTRELRVYLDALSELFRTVREIGFAEVELKADGPFPFVTRLAVRTPTALAAAVDENIIVQSDDAEENLE